MSSLPYLVRNGLDVDSGLVPGQCVLRQVGPVNAQREEKFEIGLVGCVAVEVRGGALAVGVTAVACFGEAPVDRVRAANPSPCDRPQPAAARRCDADVVLGDGVAD